MRNRSPPEAVQEPERLLSITKASIIYKPFYMRRNIEEIIRQQRAWLDKLQKQSKKPILIKALEGKVPNELKNSNASGLYTWSYYKDVFHMLQAPYFTRSILVNEIVLDPDTQIWDDLKQELDKIISTLQRLNIPYLLAYSGGKGCHLHVFFDISMSLPDGLFDKAREAHFDLHKAVRQYIFEYIIEQSGASVEKLKIDKPKINWQIFSMGSQVRDFGTLRDNGFCKTLINEVPATRPNTPLPLIFPETVPLWTIPEVHHGLIIKRIQDGIERQVTFNKEIPTNLTGITDIEKIPCIATIMKGLDTGRYYGASAIVLMGKELGYAWEKTEPLVTSYLNKCTGLNQEGINLRRDNAYPLLEAESRFSCKWIRENLKDVCPGRCVVTEKREESQQTNGYEPDPMTNQTDEVQERRINIELPEDHFISQYIKWGESVTDAYKEYHIVNGLWLLSAATSRKVVLKLRQEYIRPNLWVMTLGNSTTSRKSTAVNKARKIFEAATDMSLPNDDFSLEGYLESLAECPIMHNIKDEASGLLAKFHQRYNDGIFEFECLVYDGSPEILQKRLASGKAKTPRTYTIKNYYVTKLYATTPDKLAHCMSIADFMCGYGYRWIYNYPKYKHERKPLELEQPEDVEAWMKITGRIRDFYNIFKQKNEIIFSVSPETMQYYDEICIDMENKVEEQNNDILNSIIGRAQIHVLKIAMLLELGKAKVSTTITDESIKIAVEMVTDFFIPSIMETIERLQEDVKNNFIEKIIGVLRRLGGAGSHTKLLRDTNMKSKEFTECINTMLESHRIRIEQEKPRVYKLLNHNTPLNLRSVRKVRNVRSYIEGDNSSTKITKTHTRDTYTPSPPSLRTYERYERYEQNEPDKDKIITTGNIPVTDLNPFSTQSIETSRDQSIETSRDQSIESDKNTVTDNTVTELPQQELVSMIRSKILELTQTFPDGVPGHVVMKALENIGADMPRVRESIAQLTARGVIIFSQNKGSQCYRWAGV